MISVTGLSGNIKASYYTGSPSAQEMGAESYYVNGGPGVWLGSGTGALGVTGPVREKALAQLLRGRSPVDGRELVQVQRRAGQRRQVAWDVTLSDPKPLSALCAVADPQLRKAINAIRREVIASVVVPYIESLCETRRGKGGHVREPVKVAVAAFFEMYSRENQPQAHTHLVIPGIGVRRDGTTGTILSRPIYQHQGAINALYMCAFAQRLEERLGLRCDRVNQWFEIRGVSRELCRYWSSRKDQIDRAVLDRGVSSAAAREMAALATRKSKHQHLSEGELLHRWRAEARAYGLTPETVPGLLGKTPRRAPEAEMREVVRAALAGLNETHSHFVRRDLLRAAWTEAIGRGISVERVRSAVEDVLARSPEVVALGCHRGEEHFATRGMMLLEERLLTLVDKMKGATNHTLREGTVENLFPRHRDLTDEQRHAVRAVTLRDSGVSVVTGLPGSGKTRTLAVVREAFASEGYDVIGIALAGKAARGLESGSGIRSRTVESFLRALAPGAEAKHHLRQLARAALGKPTRAFEPIRLTKKTVLVIDEAGMIDTFTMLRVMDQARRANSKVILVGDPDQLQPIGPGGPLRAIAARVGDAAASLATITRQREEWARDSILAVRRGEGEKALAAYAVRGLLDVSGDRASAMRSLVEAWKKEGVANPKDNLILASHNAEVDRLNRLAQDARRSAGEVGGFRLGRMPSLLGAPHVKLDSGDRLYEGDRVMFARTAAIGVNNGDLGTVLKIDQGREKITVRFDDRKKPVTISTKYYKDLALGYAVTTHRAQGMTTEHAFVLLGGGMQDRETTFVQLSRARGTTRLYTDRLEAGPRLENLVKQVGKSRVKDLAHDVIDQSQQQALVQQIQVV